MENFKLIEQYLSGKLSKPDAQAFEWQMRADATLRKEVALQKQVIEVLKTSHPSEPQSRLKNISIPLEPPTVSAATMSIAGVILLTLTAALIYFKLWNTEPILTPITYEKHASIIDEKIEGKTIPLPIQSVIQKQELTAQSIAPRLPAKDVPLINQFEACE